MLKTIGIEKLVSNGNVREEVDDTLNDLADSIRANGLIEPIVVRELSSGKYEILAGHRRYEALKMINEKFVDCNVVDDVCTKEDIYRIQLAENVQRKNMSAIEYVKMFDVLKEEYGIDNAKLALYLNKSISWVRKQYTAVTLLKNKYGDKIPENVAKQSAATITAAFYSGPKTPSVRKDGNGFSCTQKRHSYIIFCTDCEFETKLRSFLKDNGVDLGTTADIK